MCPYRKVSMSNILDVALKAHVSIATVSRVVNNSDHKVNPTTREKVLEAIRELDYRPNALAKGLLMKKTMTIGIIIPDISNPYYAEIVRGIQDMADQAGYAVMLHNTDGKKERIIRYIYLLREKSVDGVIFSGGIINGYETLSILRELKERVVVVGRHEVDFPAVRIDNMGGATQAVQHLVDLGHRRIGCIGGPLASTTALDRLTGYRNALAQNGLAFEERLVKRGAWDPESGYQLAKQLLKSRKKPTAVFSINDQMAFGVIRAAKELGLKVPPDLAVVGFDNIPSGSYIDPPLTTVGIPMYDIGTAAMQMLIDLLSGEEFDKLRLFNTKLLIRESTVGGERKKD
jgi:LacI family transcriptional regulator